MQKKKKKKVINKPLKKVIKKVEIKTVEAPVQKSKILKWLGMANAFLKKHKLNFQIYMVRLKHSHFQIVLVNFLNFQIRLVTVEEEQNLGYF